MTILQKSRLLRKVDNSSKNVSDFYQALMPYSVSDYYILSDYHDDKRLCSKHEIS